MAIFRGTGGSVEGITEADILTIAISQGGTGAQTAAGARTNLGLGTAATTASSDYATAAQGALADTAVQPGDLGSVATSNSYDDLDGLPTLGTASAEDVGYFATAAQGALANSATQPGDLATVATSGSYDDLSNKPTVPTNLNSLTDVVITSATTNETLQFNGTNWVNASAGSGTVTSVAMSVPTGLTVSGSPVTTSGTLAVTLTSGYAIPTTAKQTEWDTAYTDRNKWDGGATGLTAATGRTSLGLGTAATTAATDYATAAQGSNADTAYGWGNHASAGYAADSAVVHDTGDETIAGLKTFSTGIVLGRVNSASEGGQVDLCRSSDNASAWAIDVYGDTSTPSLRFVDNTASATRMEITGAGAVTIGGALTAASFNGTIDGGTY